MVEEQKHEVVLMGNFVKSNMLIQSKYKITTLGNKIMTLGLYYLQKGEYSYSKSGGNLVCTIPAQVIKEKLKWNGNSIYYNLDRIASQLTNCKFGYKNTEKKEFSYINLFTQISYTNGQMEMIFNGDMKAYLTELESNYTIFNLPLLMQWQRTYTFRLFEILSSKAYQFKDNGYNCVFEMNAAEFKFLIGCYDIDSELVRSILKDKMISSTDYEKAEIAIVEGMDNQKDDGKGKIKKVRQYFKWYDFRRNVLDPAIEEINKTPEADMIIDKVEPIKSGRGGKVCALKIYYKTHINESVVKKNETMSEDDKMDFILELKMMLSNYPLKSKHLKEIAEVSSYDMKVCKKAVSVLESTKTEVQDVVAFLKSAIINDWEESIKKEKVTEFHKFMQQDYDFDELERKLLSK